MSRFPERNAAALLIVDAQEGPTASLPEGAALVGVIAGVVARARLAGVPVIWLRRTDADLRPGEHDWQLSDQLSSEPGELLIDHAWDDGFIETDLADALGGFDVGQLWLAGLGSETGVLQTYLGALHRGFDVTLIEDAHAGAGIDFDGCQLSGAQVVAFVNNLVWRDLAPGATGNLMAARNIEFAADELDDAAIIALAEAEATANEDLSEAQLVAELPSGHDAPRS